MSKGVTFSFILILLSLSLMGLIIIQKGLVFHRRESLAIESRIKDMNNLYDSIVRDVNKAIDIITKRAMSVAVSHILITGQPLEQANTDLEELVLSGTLNNTPEGLMENATLPDWITSMEEVGNLKGYNLSLTFDDFSIKPYDSWNLIVEGIFSVNIVDQQGIASLTRSFDVDKLISIEDFEDPIYGLNTLGRATNFITRTSFNGNYTTLLVSGDGNNSWVYGNAVVIPSSEADTVPNKISTILITEDAGTLSVPLLNSFLGVVSEGNIPQAVSITYIGNATDAMTVIPNNTNVLVDGDGGKVWFLENFREHGLNSLYSSSETGGSFLDRLEGQLEVQTKYSIQSPYTIGLESFVDKNYFSTLGLEVKETQTSVDYLYFSNSSISGDRIKTMPSDFGVDSSHQSVYGVDELVES